MNLKKLVTIWTILCLSIVVSMSAVALTADYSDGISGSSDEEGTIDYGDGPAYYAQVGTGSENEMYTQPSRYFEDEPPIPVTESPRYYEGTPGFINALGRRQTEGIDAPEFGRDSFQVGGDSFDQKYRTGHGRYLLATYDNEWENQRADEVWTDLLEKLGSPYTVHYSDHPYYNERRLSFPYTPTTKESKVIFGIAREPTHYSRIASDPRLRSIFKNVYGINWDKPLQRRLVDEYGPTWQVQRDRAMFDRLKTIYGDPFRDINDVPLVHTGTAPEIRAFRAPNTVKAPLVNLKKDLKEHVFWSEVAKLNIGLLSLYSHNYGILAFQKGNYILDFANPYEITFGRRLISDDVLLTEPVMDSMNTATKILDPFDRMKVSQYYGNPELSEDIYQYWTTPGNPPGILA